MAGTNEFDLKASGWDEKPERHERSQAIANEMLRKLPVRKGMRAMEYGAGTGILSFLLKDHLDEILLMDSSAEMIKVADKKIEAADVRNLVAIRFDLEHEIYSGKSFDLIFSQMVLHHLNDIRSIFRKFHKMLNTGGYLAVADLYSEDGSFHGEGFTGHKGFDIKELKSLLKECGFNVLSAERCFAITKIDSRNEVNQFPVFLLIAGRK
jgi:ubiquinone/menaquinone biosynthesis C-methylase UbiE